MSADRPDEKFAFAVVSRVLGVLVEEHDTGKLQAAVDGLLHYADGHIAALEISSLGPPEEARTMNLLNKSRHKRYVEGITSDWIISLPWNFHPAKFPQIDNALRHCEKIGARRLSRADGTNYAVDELLDLGVSGTATAESATGAAVVWLVTASIGGFTGTGSQELPRQVNDALLESKMQTKLKKLGASGYKEQHLFLNIRSQAFSFPVYENLCFGGPLPSEPPQLPDGLTELWLASGIKDGGVVRAIAGQEWRREHPFD
ncbi:hypothetical protein [Lentzea sp. NPDC051838]|uniref:hypothetical protein n=1 Tax=Lentzea sp. NPDC051838 TaxID=3154849 RepID=UPI00342611EA